MQVRALRDGYYKGVRRREGSVFLVEEGAKSKWFEPVKEDVQPVVEEVEVEKPRRGRPPKEVSNGKQ